jgi:hypothetical protein
MSAQTRPPLQVGLIKRINSRSTQAKNNFNSLLTKCDDKYLSHLLANLCMTFPSEQEKFVDRFGLTRREFQKLLRGIRRCARDIDKLPLQQLQNLRTHPPVKAEDLPRQLFAVASRLEIEAKRTRRRGRPQYDNTLAALVVHVYERFGTYRHDCVSCIVEAVRGDDYSVEAHRDWVRKHKSLLKSQRQVPAPHPPLQVKQPIKNCS